jgi:hypothetical protein
MKKIIILVLIVLFMAGGLVFGDNLKEGKQTQQEKPSYKVVTKSYFLKHASPSLIRDALRGYFVNASYVRGGNIFTVKILNSNVAKFEDLLKKLDVEKKEILIRIFTVIASNEGKGGNIDNKELKQVLSKLQKLLSFKSFRLDGVSALTVKDGQRHGKVRLSSSTSSLKLELEDIYVKRGTSGQRSVGFEFSLNQETRITTNTKDGSSISRDTLIESETTVKENGYLVAGVSKIGKNGDSLVLIINAEIK